MLESSRSAESLTAARVARTVSTSEPSMSVAVAGGDGSSASPVMPGERVQVRRADDVADLTQRGLRVLGVRLEAEQPADRGRVLRRQQHEHDRRHVAADAQRDAGDLGLGRADAARPPRPSGSRARRARSGRPAGRAFPTARSTRCRRRCSRARAVRRVGCRCRSRSSGGHYSSGLCGFRDGVAVDDQGDLTVGEHRGSRKRRSFGDLRRQRTRDQLALAVEDADRERQPLPVAAHDDRVGRVGAASHRTSRRRRPAAARRR